MGSFDSQSMLNIWIKSNWQIRLKITSGTWLQNYSAKFVSICFSPQDVDQVMSGSSHVGIACLQILLLFLSSPWFVFKSLFECITRCRLWKLGLLLSSTVFLILCCVQAAKNEPVFVLNLKPLRVKSNTGAQSSVSGRFNLKRDWPRPWSWYLIWFTFYFLAHCTVVAATHTWQEKY